MIFAFPVCSKRTNSTFHTECNYTISVYVKFQIQPLKALTANNSGFINLL